MRDSAIGALESSVAAKLHRELSAEGCHTFIRRFVELSSALLDADMVMVARMSDVTDQARTLNCAARGMPLPNFTYPLKGTPCEAVLRTGACVHEDGIASLFPDDPVLAKNGLRSYVGAPLHDGDKPIGIVAVLFKRRLENSDEIIEILEHYHRRLTADLLECETAERSRLAVRGGSDGVWDWCMQTGELYVNARYCELLGLPPKDMIESVDVLRERLHPDDRERVELARLAHFEKGGDYDLSARLMTESGEYRWFRTRGEAVRDALGRAVRMVGVVTDIHDLVEARHQATEASRAKSKFLATMSHEIRTPLNGVLGMASLLSSTDLEPSQINMVKLIEDSGQALLDILNDVLDIANIENGRFDIEEAAVYQPADLVEALATPFRLKAQEKNLRLHVEIDPLARQALPGDPARIRQILSNLLSNAVKFTERGEVRLRCLMVREGDGEERVRFEVCDTGIGIEKELQSRIFLPFVQAEPLLTRKYGGTGLGLSIAHKLAELMGGEISVESAPGAGSVFTLSLPTVRKGSAEPAEPVSPPALLG